MPSYMRAICRRSCPGLAFGLLVAWGAPTALAAAKGDDTTVVESEAIQVEAPALPPAPVGERITVSPGSGSDTSPDTADLVERVPGGAVSDNGPISGQVNYRGMFGPRMNVRIDGMHVNPGGPNWMDTPLHYAPGPLVEDIIVTRGLAPVSSGAESIGGTVQARTKRSHFTDSPTFSTAADATVAGKSATSAGTGGFFLSRANNRHRMHALGSFDVGDDIEFPGGEIGASQYERYSGGFGYGFRPGPDQSIGFDYRHTETDDTGNPSLPMDIRFFDTEMLRATYDSSLDLGRLNAEVYYSDIDHRMDNVTLRAGPASPAGERQVDAQSDGLGWKLTLGQRLGNGRLTTGIDGHLASQDMQITNPSMGDFFVDNFNDVQRDRVGLFSEWRGRAGEAVDIQAGVRVTRVDMSAGSAAVGAMPSAPPLIRLLDEFNGSSRDATDTQVDAVLKLGLRLTEQFTLRAEAGRKTRSPSYIERFAWLPIEASAGLADGNNYVGDNGLDPEIAHEIGLGLDWLADDGAYVTPRVFYRDVKDYIQGVPFDDTPGTIDSDVERVSNANGDPTPLRYANVDAELYGFDLGFGYPLTQRLSLDGQASFTRGKRQDVDDNLYRIPPLKGRLRLSYDGGEWGAYLEGQFAAEQDKISEANNDPSTDDPRTPGYGLVNIGAQVQVADGLRVDFGVNNVFDREYRDHLSGFNRVSKSDVAVGERLPGSGISAFVRASYEF